MNELDLGLPEDLIIHKLVKLWGIFEQLKPIGYTPSIP
jgi:hypothetical protein